MKKANRYARTQGDPNAGREGRWRGGWKTRTGGALAAVLILLLVGPADTLSAQAPDNVRLVFQLVEADGFQDRDPEIADVVEELRSLFRFEGYRLVSTGLVNASPRGYASTLLTGGELGTYQVEVNLEPVVETNEDGPDTLSRDRVRIGVGLNHEGEGTAMNATVTVRDGQTLVLGSTRTRAGAALILVMRTTFN